GMDGKQSAVWEGAGALGRSYVTAVPGVDELTGERIPKLVVSSATRTLTFYEDPANDDWPLYAMVGQPARAEDGTAFWRMKVYDAERVWTVDVQDGKAKYVEFRSEEHTSELQSREN